MFSKLIFCRSWHFLSFLLFELSIFYSFVSEALWCWSSQPIISFVKDHVISFCLSIQPECHVLHSSSLILSSFASRLNRSAARIWSSLIPFLNRRVFNIYLPFNLKVSQCSLSLVSNGVFSTLFSFVLFFSWICSTSQGSLVSLVCQRSNLVLPLLFLFRCPSGAILDLGTRSSHSGGVL